jgi:hypothetical protein
MKTQAIKSRHLSMLIMGIAVIVFGAAVSAAIMRWLPVATAQTVGDAVQAVSGQADGQVRAKSRCPGCGVIVSMREIGSQDKDSAPEAAAGVMYGSRDEIQINPDKRYEIVVRMADQSRRVINHASPASWRPGERVVVIGGASPTNK